MLGAICFLVALHERADESVFEAAKELIGRTDTDDRILGLIILREPGFPGSRPVFPRTWDLLEGLAQSESDPRILYHVLSCLGWTANHRALPPLLRFAQHSDPLPRLAVADNLAGCAPRRNDPTMVAGLLRLADDEDVDVRWSAFYDLVEWVTKDTPAILALLAKRGVDPDPEVRKLAVRMRRKCLRRSRCRLKAASAAPFPG